MRRLSWLFAITLLLGLSAPAFAQASGPEVGQSAPTFRLQDQNGKWRTPADFEGRWLVLYFYPKDFTPGCTTQVCTFRDDIVVLRKAGAEVIGVSLDDVKSHAEFSEKYKVPFPLLSDANREVATAYGVLVSRMGMHYTKRSTFLIDPQGKVAKVYHDVDPEKNAAQVLADLTALKAAS